MCIKLNVQLVICINPHEGKDLLLISSLII